MTYKAALLFDKNNDWIYQFFKNHDLRAENFLISSYFDINEVNNFDVVFLLGYTKILSKKFLSKNSLTLVVHESSLPEGAGFSPLQWQLLAGKSEINISLIEALEKVDSGDILLQHTMVFDGTELYEEIRSKQANSTINIIEQFLLLYPNFTRRKQNGVHSFFRKRNVDDSELDFQKSIEDNFNLLRVSNNEEWPSFFFYKKQKFIVKIYKE